MEVGQNIREAVPKPIVELVEKLKSRGFESFLVGGGVRDLLMGRPPKDFDVATAARPEQVQELFKRVIPTGIQHGTVTVLTRAGPVEVTTFRTEGPYKDGRRPESVEYHGDIDVDLSRRDFTINAIALDPQGVLRDPFQGQEDLRKRIVRSVGRAEDRFSEDGLRPLRAIRLATVLDFELEPKTRQAIAASLESFRRISVERIREEFIKILLSERAGKGIAELQSTGMLEIFLPEVSATAGVKLAAPHRFDLLGHLIATVDAAPMTLELRLAALLHDLTQTPSAQSAQAHASSSAVQVDEILTRLKFPTKVIDAVALVVAEHVIDEARDFSPADVRRWAARVGESALRDLLIFTAANRRARGIDETASLNRLKALEHQVEEVLAERPPLRPNQLALDGREVMKILAVGPSPVVGEATRFLMDVVLEKPAANTATELARRLKQWHAGRR